MAAFSDRLWLIGGLVPLTPDGIEVSEIWYSSDGLAWSQLVDTFWLPRHAPSAIAVKDRLILLGGTVLTNEGRMVVNDVYQIKSLSYK